MEVELWPPVMLSVSKSSCRFCGNFLPKPRFLLGLGPCWQLGELRLRPALSRMGLGEWPCMATARHGHGTARPAAQHSTAPGAQIGLAAPQLCSWGMGGVGTQRLPYGDTCLGGSSGRKQKCEV